VNARLADYVFICKENSAKDPGAVALVERNLRALNSRAPILHCDSPVFCSQGAMLKGKVQRSKYKKRCI
jgi:predicted GTPase